MYSDDEPDNTYRSYITTTTAGSRTSGNANIAYDPVTNTYQMRSVYRSFEDATFIPFVANLPAVAERDLIKLFIPNALTEKKITDIPQETLKEELSNLLNFVADKEERKTLKKLIGQDDLLEMLNKTFSKLMLSSVYSDAREIGRARKERQNLMREIISDGKCNED